MDDNETTIATRIGDAIYEERKAKKLSQLHLAERMGIDRSQISDWERGVHEMSISALLGLAAALNIRASDIVKDIERPL